MDHNPIIVKPTSPHGPPGPSVSSDIPTGDASPFLRAQPSRQTTHIANPDTALAHALIAASKSQTIANRIPRLKMSAYILIGFVLLSLVQTFAMQSVVVSMLGPQAGSGAAITASWAIMWAVELCCGILALSTKSVKNAKMLLIAVGTCFAYSAAIALFRIDIIGAAFDGFVLWWIYTIYETVETLEM